MSLWGTFHIQTTVAPWLSLIYSVSILFPPFTIGWFFFLYRASASLRAQGLAPQSQLLCLHFPSCFPPGSSMKTVFFQTLPWLEYRRYSDAPLNGTALQNFLHGTHVVTPNSQLDISIRASRRILKFSMSKRKFNSLLYPTASWLQSSLYVPNSRNGIIIPLAASTELLSHP